MPCNKWHVPFAKMKWMNNKKIIHTSAVKKAGYIQFNCCVCICNLNNTRGVEKKVNRWRDRTTLKASKHFLLGVFFSPFFSLNVCYFFSWMTNSTPVPLGKQNIYIHASEHILQKYLTYFRCWTLCTLSRFFSRWFFFLSTTDDARAYFTQM